MTINTAKQTKRSPWIDPDATSRPVFVLSDRHDRIKTSWHSHRRTQFIHVSAGLLTVLTRTARFVIPPQRAVWIGAEIEHRIISSAPFWLTTCYVERQLVSLSEAAHVVAVDRLSDELLIAAADLGGNYAEGGPETRLMAVLLDRLAMLPSTDIVLPEPSDPRLTRITNRLFANPATGATLAQLAADAAMTERTAARLFVKDTGLTFGVWRQHMRLQTALKHLAASRSVTETALAVGYGDVSSFIAAFKQAFGRTPLQTFDR